LPGDLVAIAVVGNDDRQARKCSPTTTSLKKKYNKLSNVEFVLDAGATSPRSSSKFTEHPIPDAVETLDTLKLSSVS